MKNQRGKRVLTPTSAATYQSVKVWQKYHRTMATFLSMEVSGDDVQFFYAYMTLKILAFQEPNLFGLHSRDLSVY